MKTDSTIIQDSQFASEYDSSVLFHKAGLQVFGLDGSSEVLEVCGSKGFAAGSKQHEVGLPTKVITIGHGLHLSLLWLGFRAA